MEYEIELKLLTDKTAGEVINTKLLPELGVDVKRDSLVLTNHYFDSKERTLRKNDIGLRIRGNNQHFEQTLKTAGKSIGGLHQRSEYNVSLDAPSTAQQAQFPKLALFPKTAWPNTINPMELEPKLEVLFTTHFKRESYLIAVTPSDSVEMVWDLGEIRSGNKTLEICEIELELKKGSASALFLLARRLVQLLPTSIGVDSKAARGYSLLDDYRPNIAFQENGELFNPAVRDVNGYVSSLENKLRHFQRLLVVGESIFTQQNAAEVKDVLLSLLKQLSNFAEHYPCKTLQQLIEDTQKLLDAWPAATESADPATLMRFLQSASSTQLQLDILQSLIEQPWLPNHADS